jgi:hypothetical protein
VNLPPPSGGLRGLPEGDCYISATARRHSAVIWFCSCTSARFIVGLSSRRSRVRFSSGALQKAPLRRGFSRGCGSKRFALRPCQALAEKHGIEIEAKHWRRAEAATTLHEKGVLPKDLSDLHGLLNEERKGMFYEGEDPDLGDRSMEDVLTEVETAVEVAEAEAG